ncbi:MAG: hypothetical protein HFE90_09555 [Firmicutes bacterium]|nr:hypothetical protein [Bacillota bacterium]
MSGNKHLIYIPSTLKSVKEHMTPAEFISTESVRKYIQARMLRVTSNIKIEVVYDDMNYTDGKEIHLNPYEAAAYTKSNFDALLMLLGNAFHETLHIIHTDFEVCHKYHIGFINGKKVLYNSGEYYLYRKLVSDLVEDCAIEFWGKRQYPGTLKKSLEFADAVHYGYRADPEQMLKNGSRPIDILFSALVTFGIMDIVPEFPAELSVIKNMFNECKPLITAAKVAQKTADRCKVANDIFEIARPLMDDCMEKGEKCPVFDPIQPSTHNRFKRYNQNFSSFRKVRPDEYDLRVDMEALTEAAAKDEYDRKIDRRYSDQLVLSISKLQDDGLGPFHNTIDIEYIQTDLAKFATYREAYSKRVLRLTPKIKLLLKGLLAVVQREQDDTVRNLYAGNQYREPFRADKKCCAYRKALSDEADLFIYVLVDSSGSMGAVTEYVKDALTMFYEVCRKMDVPITIVSHTANDNIVTIRTLVDANMRSGENTGIEGFEVQGGTRDGVALSCAAEYLKFRREAQKIVIAISDGEPWHTCDLNITPELLHMAKIAGIKPSNTAEFFREYSNYSSADVKNVIRNRGIHPIGIALAPTMELANLLNLKMKALYPESFATDIDHLAKKLAKVLEKYLYD